METYHYLVIIRKSDFIDLFKYGHFNVCHIQEFDGDLEKHANNIALFERVTSNMNIFEYSFEYLMVHFEKDYYCSSNTEIDIKDVQNIYTFDQEAKREMSISFDPRIQLHVSPWSQYFEELKQNLFIKQSLRGINNLWTVFGLNQDDLVKCEELISKVSIEESFRELFANERPLGNLPIWVYLLRYERHSFYPKDMRGFFCDFIHVFCNFLKQSELNNSVAETTEIYPQLMSSENIKFSGLLTVVENSPLNTKSEEIAKCKFAIVAPLFLYLKDKYKEGFSVPEKDIIGYVKSFGIEGTLAVYLLGITLGYDKTYDAFYESANLKFFKNHNSICVEDNSKDSNSTKEISTTTVGISKATNQKSKNSEVKQISQSEKTVERTLFDDHADIQISSDFPLQEKERLIPNKEKKISKEEKNTQKDRDSIKTYDLTPPKGKKRSSKR